MACLHAAEHRKFGVLSALIEKADMSKAVIEATEYKSRGIFRAPERVKVPYTAQQSMENVLQLNRAGKANPKFNAANIQEILKLLGRGTSRRCFWGCTKLYINCII